MMPTLLAIGPVGVSSFGVFMAMAFIVLLYLVWRHLHEFSVTDGQIFDHLLLVLGTALIGARVWFVLTHGSVFAKNILFPFMVWKFPGFAFWGGFLVALPALYLFAKLLKLPVMAVFDSYGASYPFAMLFGSLAVFLDGTVAGKETSTVVGMMAVGETGRRHPVGLYALILAFVACVVVSIILKKYSLKQLTAGSMWLGILSFAGFSQLLLAFVSQNLLYFKTIPIEYVISTILAVWPLVPLFQLLRGPKYANSLIQRIKTKLREIKV